MRRQQRRMELEMKRKEREAVKTKHMNGKYENTKDDGNEDSEDIIDKGESCVQCRHGISYVVQSCIGVESSLALQDLLEISFWTR